LNTEGCAGITDQRTATIAVPGNGEQIIIMTILLVMR
jgi:hypothetical protein